MKKVLIISYFFPPNNFTASNRAYGFAKYLKSFGYYPIIITRNWDCEVQKIKDLTKPSGDKIIHEKNDDFEVYYLPFKGSLRDRFQAKHGSKFSLIRKVLSFLELILENFSLRFLSHSNFYYKSLEIISKENVKNLIISSSPFNQFYYGYLLKNKFPKLKWIADYRDEWNSRTLIETNGLLNVLIFKIQSRKEMLWVRTAEMVISVSKRISQNISRYTQNPNFETIENGFFDEDFNSLNKSISNSSEYIISYTGEIYDKQDFSIFLNALKKVIEEFKDEIVIKLQFIGLKRNPEIVESINNLMGDYAYNLVFTKRLSREKCVELEFKSNLLLMVAYGNLKGIPSSKLYQYIGSKNDIFLCPSDNDIIEKYICNTNQGFIANDSKEAYSKLKTLINNHLEGKSNIPNIEKIQKFSRRHQVKKLAEILNSF